MVEQSKKTILIVKEENFEIPIKFVKFPYTKTIIPLFIWLAFALNKQSKIKKFNTSNIRV
jgi:hypothetical protein